MTRHARWTRAGLGLVAVVTSGCADDFVDPFQATEGMTGSSSDTGAQPDDDGQDDGQVDSTGTGGGDGDSGGTTMMVADESSSGGPPVSTGTTDGGESSGGGESSSGGEESSTGDPPPDYQPCPEGVLPNAPLPQTVNGSSSGEDSEFASTCGGGGAPDIAWLFTAPADGDYTFDTMGSTVDTVLYVLDGECAGKQLQCDDDGLVNTTQSMMSVSLLQDQTVTVVADSFGLQGGNVNLTVREGSVSCPVDIGSAVPQTVSSQTNVATDEFTGSCGLGAAADQGFVFTPPQDGTYTFEITNNTFDTLLYILDGECSGSELGCNDNLVGSLNGASGLALGLPAGQPVTIVVDGAFGAGGTFDLNIGMLEGDCPDADLGNMAPPFTVSDTTVGEDNATTGTCGGLASTDFAYTWTAPFEATFSFDTFGSAFDTVVYVLDGTCTGPELGCSNDTLAGTTSSTIAHLTAGQEAVVVVDGNGAQGNFDLNVDVDCPAFDLGSTVPQVHSADTLTASDAFLGTCNLGAAPDEGFTFTAPADGTYTFETANNNFDTLLYVLDGVCGGAELACNDNLAAGSPTGASGVAIPLTAGQQVTVIVDGSFGGAGTFDLVIGQLSGTCPDEDLGNMAVPFTVNGTTAGEDNAAAGTCGGLSSPDYTYTWTAPNAATYAFSTEGSTFDTVAYVRNGPTCGGAEIACNGGDFMTTDGIAIAELAAGQTVNVFVDGDGAASGAFTLTVSETSTCCFSHDTVGCDDAVIEACVCAADAFCCNTSWDNLCVNGAINCGAMCP